jgi:hypothetical protein
MNLPGFTAHRSLYQGINHYIGHFAVHEVGLEIAVAPDSLRAVRSIIRATAYPRYLPSCYARCVQNCYYPDPFCEENCRCICFGIPGRTCHLQ